MIMKVLVIEDEHKIANSIKKGMEQEGWAVDVCYNGTEGYDMASSEEYDVLVLDLMLPGMDGAEVCRKIREEGNHTPVLMLTAKGLVADKVEGFKNGADDYLVKPFAFEELLARVRALSRRPKQLKDIKYKSGNLELDANLMMATLNGKEIILSRKEFSLLEYLLKNQGKTVSKENIINHLWNYEANILPNTVEVFVKYLRNKIGKEKIRTIRGFGYRID
jgi:DNA-binding response OmpR family regulator